MPGCFLSQTWARGWRSSSRKDRADNRSRMAYRRIGTRALSPKRQSAASCRAPDWADGHWAQAASNDVRVKHCMAHRLLPRLARAALEVSPMTRCLRAHLEIDEKDKRQQTDAGEHKQIRAWGAGSACRGRGGSGVFLFLVALILFISSRGIPSSSSVHCTCLYLGSSWGSFTWPGGGGGGCWGSDTPPRPGQLSSIYAASGPVLFSIL